MNDAACCFKTYYACAGETIEVLNDELLCNDITNSPPQKVTRVWTFPIHPAPVPNASGTGWLIQIPNNVSIITYNYTVTGCDCRQHNASFTILVEKQCPPCTFTPDPCDNLLCFGDFENFTNTTSVESRLGWPIIFQGAQVAGSPDIKATNLGNQYLFLGNYNNREAVNLELQNCIEPGCFLTMSMDLSITGGFAKHLEVWGSTGRPCDATVLGANPIANSCTQTTACDLAYTFEPVCIFDDEFLASNQLIDNNNPNFAHSGPHTWENLTDQNVCFLTLVPTGIGGVYLDNISATVTCEPEITCAETTDDEVCQGGFADISFVVCAPDLPEGLGLTLVTPTVVLPSGWTLVGGNLAPFSLTEGQCKGITIQVSVPASASLGSIETIMLSGTATGLCTTAVGWSCSAEVTVSFCPPASFFACPCLTNGLNIDATSANPLYNSNLHGVMWSTYAQANSLPDILDASVHHGCIAIAGRLIIDRDVEIKSCNDLRMQPCSEISVGTGLPSAAYPSLLLYLNKIYGCVQMWKGITVQPLCHLNMGKNSIEDAQYAVTAIGSNAISPILNTSVLAITNNFVRNHIGFYIPTDVSRTVLHSPFVSNNFIGSISGHPLLPPCDAGLPNHSLQMGYAGLVTLGTAFDVGTPGVNGYVNTFRDIRNGVIGEGSPWMNVYRARFDNVVGYMGINGFPTFNGSSGVGVLQPQSGFLSVENSRFESVGHAIFTANTAGLSVLNNEMPDVYTGIQAYSPVGFDLSENPSINFRDWGIVVRNPLQLPPINKHLYIKNNVLSSIEYDADMIIEEAGISVTNSYNFSKTEDARILGNQLTTRDVKYGVYVTNVNNWLIDGNTVTIEPLLSNLPYTDGQGISLSTSSYNFIYGNTVTDNGVVQSEGISVSSSPVNTFCCNTTDFTNKGIYFQGNCDNTVLRTLQSDGNDDYELECTVGTIISDQPNLTQSPGSSSHSNKFYVGSSVEHGGNNLQVSNSEFFVKSILPPDHPENISLPLIPGGYDPTNPKWFIASVIENQMNECGTIGDCPGLLQFGEKPDREKELSETDRYFASGEFLVSPYGDALNWEGRLRLYKRLQNYPELLGESTTIDSFYYNAENTAIAQYSAVEAAVEGITSLPPEWESIMQNAWDDIGNVSNSAKNHLEGLASVNTWEDSLIIYRTAEQIRLTALSAYQNLMQYIDLSDSLRKVKAHAAWTLNEALSVIGILQSNTKMVNRVYLETLESGASTLSPAQFATISPIAWQCPLEGGKSVYRARSLYLLQQAADFDDGLICGLNGSEREQKSKNYILSGNLKVQPNPATEQIFVSLPENMVNDDIFVKIMDLNGRIMSKQSDIGTGALQFNVASFPTGIYICTITGGSNVFAPVKFVVQH